MKWLVTINEKKYYIKVPDRIVNGVAFEAKLGDQELTLRWQSESESLYLIERNEFGQFEKRLSVRNKALTRYPGEAEYHWETELVSHAAKVKSGRASRYVEGQEQRMSSQAQSGSTVRSNLTGKVLAVQVKENDQVEKGDLLFVVEAMKMENKIEAEVAGVAHKIKIKPGDKVNVGQVLAVIE